MAIVANAMIGYHAGQMADQTRTRHVRDFSPGWTIRLLARWLGDAMNERLAPHGLSIQTFAVMMTVPEHGPMTLTRIGKQYGRPACAISRVIDRLEDLGLAQRRAHRVLRRRSRPDR